MAQQTINNAEAWLNIRGKINTMFSEVYTSLSNKLNSTFTKAQLDTAVTDGDIAFTNQANVFTAIQGISESFLYIGGTSLSDTVGGNGKASIDVRNDTSGAIYRARVNASNNYVIEYFNGVTWSNKLIVGNDGSLTVNGQNRTSTGTSWTPTRTAGITTSVFTINSATFKKKGLYAYVEAYITITPSSTGNFIAISCPVSTLGLGAQATWLSSLADSQGYYDSNQIFIDAAFTSGVAVSFMINGTVLCSS